VGNESPAERIRQAKANPGKHSFGNSLFLVTRPTGAGYWIQQYRDGASFRSKSLGTLADLNSYTKAVDAARRFAVERGDRKAAAAAEEAAGPLFSAVVTDYLEGYESDGHRFAGKAEGWRGGINGSEADAYRRNLIRRGKLASMRVAEVTVHDIAAHLTMLEKPKLAERARGHVEAVMAFAIAREFRTGDNPAAGNGPLAHLAWPKLDQHNGEVIHHPAMPSADVPKFFRDLQAVDTPTARALSLIVLTAVRASEAVGAKWGEIDLDAKVWTIPGSRMKGKGKGQPHAVPLTPQMLAIIGKPGAPDDFAFPGNCDGHVGPKNPMHTLELVYKGDAAADVHGFRSTFSDWVIDHTDFEDRERLADIALGHYKDKKQGTRSQRAYQRSLQAERRRPIMQAWSDFVTTTMGDLPTPCLQAAL
jgi:integrase